jgi:hypothetical protein
LSVPFGEDPSSIWDTILVLVSSGVSIEHLSDVLIVSSLVVKAVALGDGVDAAFWVFAKRHFLGGKLFLDILVLISLHDLVDIGKV